MALPYNLCANIIGLFLQEDPRPFLECFNVLQSCAACRHAWPRRATHISATKTFITPSHRRQASRTAYSRVNVNVMSQPTKSTSRREMCRALCCWAIFRITSLKMRSSRNSTSSRACASQAFGTQGLYRSILLFRLTQMQRVRLSDHLRACAAAAQATE